jgi:hypothetical protein
MITGPWTSTRVTLPRSKLPLDPTISLHCQWVGLTLYLFSMVISALYFKMKQIAHLHSSTMFLFWGPAPTIKGWTAIVENPGIQRFVGTDVNRILHCFKHARAMISGKKLFLGVPELTVVGHRYTFEGRIPDTENVDKILNWPPCENASEV